MLGQRYVLLQDTFGAVTQGPVAELTPKGKLVLKADAAGVLAPVIRKMNMVLPTYSGELRRYIVEEGTSSTKPGYGLFTDVLTPGLQLPASSMLTALLTPRYQRHNGWCCDMPHQQTEAGGTKDATNAMLERLQTLCAYLPLDVRFVRAQRRYLLYYSDGDLHSQLDYAALTAFPSAYLWGRKGRMMQYTRTFRKSYINAKEVAALIAAEGGSITSAVVNALNATSSTRPLLYEGPAWLVRFTFGEQDPLHGCRVYVTDDARFICSDWCQRDARHTSGINLHLWQYTLDEWIAGPCITHVTRGEDGPRLSVPHVKTVRADRLRGPTIAQAALARGEGFDKRVAVCKRRIEMGAHGGRNGIITFLQRAKREGWTEEVMLTEARALVASPDGTGVFPKGFVEANLLGFPLRYKTSGGVVTRSAGSVQSEHNATHEAIGLCSCEGPTRSDHHDWWLRASDTVRDYACTLNAERMIVLFAAMPVPASLGVYTPPDAEGAAELLAVLGSLTEPVAEEVTAL